MFKVLVFQHCSRCVSIGRRGAEVGNAEGCHGGRITTVGQVDILVGPGVNGGEVTTLTGAEYHAFDRLHGGEKHAGRSFLAIDINHRVTVVERDIHLYAVALARLIGHHATVASTALRAHLGFIRQVDAGTCRTILVHELDLEVAVVVLLGHQVELNRQSTRCGDLALYFGIEEGILVREGEPLAIERHGSPNARVEVPRLQIAQLFVVCEVIVGVSRGVLLHGNGNAANPHILLVDAERNPQVAILGDAVTLLDTTNILRTEGFILTGITHRRNLTIDQVQRRILQAILRERNSQRPAELRGVINRGKAAIRQTLTPDLGVAVYEAFGAGNRLGPGVTAVARNRGQGVLPKRYDATVVERVAAECLVLLVQGNQRILAVSLLDPTHALNGAGQQLLAGLAEALILRTGVVGVVGILFVESVVVVDEVDRTKGAILVDLTNYAADTVAVVRIILRVEGDTVVADGEQTIRLRNKEAHALVHDGVHVFGEDLAVLSETVRNAIDREEHLGVGPGVTILRGLDHGHRGGYMLIHGVAEVVHVERTTPVGQHRLVVVGPAVTVGGVGKVAVGTHGLDVVNTHHGRQGTVVHVGI